MLNSPALLMCLPKKTPQVYFSLRTPWLYNDEDYCGNPRHEPGHINGSGASGPCGGAFSLDLLDENGNTISALKNKERYEADPYEMFTGTWGEFYETARVFNEPLALNSSSDSSTPIRNIKFNLRFGDLELTTVPTRENFEAADTIGNVKLTIETTANTYQVLRSSAVYCYLSGGSSGIEVLTLRNMNGEETDLTVKIPESLSICYQDIKNIYVSVTAGIVAWYSPSLHIE